MHPAALALLLLVSRATPQQGGALPAVVTDTTAKPAPRRAVTKADLATAFGDTAARTLFERARRSRLAQDSSIRSYDARVRLRFSVTAGIGGLGRDRLMYRTESASRVQWSRTAGAHIEMTGARITIPVLGSSDAERDAVRKNVTDVDLSPIPYFPGSETLWIGGSVARAEVDERRLINPLAQGAEAYYTYRTGESVSFRMPDARSIQLRELVVRPRSPLWNLVVGSLWFDVASGQLVRAAYRPSAPSTNSVDVTRSDTTRPPSVGSKIALGLVRSLLSPNVAQISTIAVEYGLYEGRFWLPRLQSSEGTARASFVKATATYENSFSYTTVNGAVSMPQIPVDTAVLAADSALSPRVRRDSITARMRAASLRQCDTSATRVFTEFRTRSRLPVEIRVPCDLDKLVHSSDLPASAYDETDAIFTADDRARVVADALSMAAQAPFSLNMLPAPRLQFGPSMTRYNRVEGFSTGLLVDQQLGGGFSAMASARYGTADHVLNTELSAARSNAATSIRLGGYRRLVAANDWGNPLSFGSSVSALLSGRDDGFYYRSTGAELLWTSTRGAPVEWRAFVERQRRAEQRTSFSVGGNFGPNIDAAAATSAGAGMRVLHSFGTDPRGFRAITDLRVEAAGGDSTYGRGALDLTLSRQLSTRFISAMTLAGGSSVGGLPVQRRWYLGGAHTVRGQSPDTAQSGNAFWFSRVELAHTGVGVRTSLFGDIGWVGDRSRVSDVGRPLSGAGIGLSGFDGLIRLDLARGIYPRQQTRLMLYLDARF